MKKHRVDIIYSDEKHAEQKENAQTIGRISTSLIPFYDRNGITIFCGDCLEIMPKIDGFFDAIIADLPYG